MFVRRSASKRAAERSCGMACWLCQQSSDRSLLCIFDNEMYAMRSADLICITYHVCITVALYK